MQGCSPLSLNCFSLQKKPVTIGHIAKDKVAGKLEALMKLIEENSAWKLSDAAVGISSLLASRSSQEIVSIGLIHPRTHPLNHNLLFCFCFQKDTTNAASISCAFLERKMVSIMEDVLDTGEKTLHSKIADDTAEAYQSPDEIAKIIPKSLAKSIDVEDVESCFHPIIMSGGKYVLKASAVSDDEPLSAGTIIMSTGARFNTYCRYGRIGLRLLRCYPLSMSNVVNV